MESLQKVVTQGNIAPVVGQLGSNEELVRGLKAVLGNDELYSINIRRIGPPKEQNTAAVATMVVDGEVLSKASLDQLGNLTVDVSSEMVKFYSAK